LIEFWTLLMTQKVAVFHITLLDQSCVSIDDSLG